MSRKVDDFHERLSKYAYESACSLCWESAAMDAPSRFWKVLEVALELEDEESEKLQDKIQGLPSPTPEQVEDLITEALRDRGRKKA